VKKNKTSEVVKRIEKNSLNRLGLCWALYRGALATLAGEEAIAEVRNGVLPLFEVHPKPGSEEAVLVKLMALRAAQEGAQA